MSKTKSENASTLYESVNIYLFPIIFVHLGNNIIVMLVFGNK